MEADTNLKLGAIKPRIRVQQQCNENATNLRSVIDPSAPKGPTASVPDGQPEPRENDAAAGLHAAMDPEPGVPFSIGGGNPSSVSGVSLKAGRLVHEISKHEKMARWQRVCILRETARDFNVALANSHHPAVNHAANQRDYILTELPPPVAAAISAEVRPVLRRAFASDLFVFLSPAVPLTLTMPPTCTRNPRPVPHPRGQQHRAVCRRTSHISPSPSSATA